MSVKAQGLVWDLECPRMYGGLEFKPSHKYVLVAYSDHADHNGKNIFPAIKTIAKKTGLDERTVQRLTKDLEAIGLLVDDGIGPRGTNRWSLPYSEGGDKLSPCQIDGVTKTAISSGDIPSGDIPSGDNLSPELKGTEQEINLKDELINVLSGYAQSAFLGDFKGWTNFKRRLEQNDITITGDPQNIHVAGMSKRVGQFSEAQVFESRYARLFRNYGINVNFQE